MMQALSISELFQSGVAKFAANSFVSDVLQKAFIRIDELGTEAAAATGMIMMLSMSMPVPAIDFIADHPFVYIIRNQETGAILFMGTSLSPEFDAEIVENSSSNHEIFCIKFKRKSKRLSGEE
jgi:serpin B